MSMSQTVARTKRKKKSHTFLFHLPLSLSRTGSASFGALRVGHAFRCGATSKFTSTTQGLSGAHNVVQPAQRARSRKDKSIDTSSTSTHAFVFLPVCTLFGGLSLPVASRKSVRGRRYIYAVLLGMHAPHTYSNTVESAVYMFGLLIQLCVGSKYF